MQNELEGLYNMLVSQTDIMKNVDELVEKQIAHELMQFKELATWSDYECERDKYMAVAEVAKKELTFQILYPMKLRKKKASWQDLTMQ